MAKYLTAGPAGRAEQADEIVGLDVEQASRGLAVARFEGGEDAGVLVDRIAPAPVGAERQVTRAFGAGDQRLVRLVARTLRWQQTTTVQGWSRSGRSAAAPSCSSLTASTRRWCSATRSW
ncbi:hypothetical protein ABIF81_003645 [Bradyrhizobium daqingense]